MSNIIDTNKVKLERGHKKDSIRDKFIDTLVELGFVATFMMNVTKITKDPFKDSFRHVQTWKRGDEVLYLEHSKFEFKGKKYSYGRKEKFLKQFKREK
jgi:hypothetical protein